MEDQNYQKHRKSIRLKDYDYSQPGFYFITICMNHQQNRLGDIENSKMSLNDAGRMIEYWLKKLPQKFLGILLDSYVIMPNHIHVIIQIVGVDPRVCPDESQKMLKGEHMGSPRQISLSEIVQWLKTMTTNNYIRNVKVKHWKPFVKRFWQRNYYEHVIREQKELYQIRKYILDNPHKWELYKENPKYWRNS